MGRLLIKFPTRNRPDKFRRMLTRYRDLLSGDHQVRFVISCDVTDWRMNRPSVRRWLREMGESVDLELHYGWSWTKIQAVNANLKGKEADVLLLASDDMNPQLEGYDARIFDAFEKYFPDFDGAIKFHDGLREDDLITYPVLGWKLFQAFGYIYHPSYLSLYCDDEQTESCKALGRYRRSDLCLLKHEWTHEHFDLLHKRNENRWMYQRDGARFEKRRAAGFDLDRVRRRLESSTGD